MPYGPKICACCGSTDEVQRHHLYATSLGCPDDLTVWLCLSCHNRLHHRQHFVRHRELTIAGLAAAKAQGAQLGNRTNLSAAQAKGRAVNAAAAAAFASNVLPIIRQIQTSGVTSLRGIARALDARG